jgi:hypothetical protein
LYAGDFDPTGERMARNISLDLYLALVNGLRDQALEQGSKRLKNCDYFITADKELVTLTWENSK